MVTVVQRGEAAREGQNEVEERRTRLRQRAGVSPAAPTDGLNHLAVISADLERAAAFYVDVLGMPLVSVVPNRDEPASTHINIDIGGGQTLSIFDFPGRAQPAVSGVGGMMHVALSVNAAHLAEILARLDSAGWPYNPHKGSVYVRDPDGMVIELASTP